MSMPRRHDREEVVNRARIKALDLVSDFHRLPEVEALTPWEFVALVQEVFGGLTAGCAKMQLRYERHGNFDTPGGWSSDG